MAGTRLQSNITGLSAAQLWQSYTVLTRAEAGFRSLKSDLGLRPNFHQREHRVDGHIFIAVLAYQLLRYITYQLEAHGDHRSWPVIRQLLQTHCYATLTAPTTSGVTWQMRKPGVPEATQRMIYDRLGVDLAALPETRTSFKQP